LGCSEVESYAFRLDNGAYAYAYWHPSNYMVSEVEHAVTLHCADLGEVRLVDPMDGTVYEIPESMMIEDEFGGKILKLLPIKDYPMFLIFGEMP
jgi:hypothetical protein